MKGYRGLLRELSRTRGGAALWLQLKCGLRHLLGSWGASAPVDGEALFVRNYAPDGFALPTAPERALSLAAQRCLACGLCSAECARVGGSPSVDPQEGVVAMSRLRSEAFRFGAPGEPASPCGQCRACEAVCPALIPIAEVLDAHAPSPGPDRAD